MPRREDINKVLLIGSGPIVIGQGCEFDYSGTQGAKALTDDRYEVVLVNSNPATIMTDPGFASRTYVEPLTPEVVEAIIAREKPEALLPTLGGQTALNLALRLSVTGVLRKHGVELLGASPTAIRTAEDRELFREAMARIGLRSPRGGLVRTYEAALQVAEEIGFPVILRPSFTMGGSGGGLAKDPEQLRRALRAAFRQSPTRECLIDEDLTGWKEFEFEVLRDHADNFAVVCAIENVDPMGVHTGDSVTVTPPMTLTDREYQRLRDAAQAVISEVGVETGGANIQFGVDPSTGDFVVIEMNPRVSRSSALASKATGFPIAKIAAKLAVGYTLDELTNDITGTSAAFEPVLDYVVVKMPRFDFEKFPDTDARLTTQMRSIGEVMAIGRSFVEASQKAARSLENGRDGLVSLLGKVDYRALLTTLRVMRDGNAASGAVPRLGADGVQLGEAELREILLEIIRTPLADRLWYVMDAFRVGASAAEVCAATQMDLWFLSELEQVVGLERALAAGPRGSFSDDVLSKAKSAGLSDAVIAAITGSSVASVRGRRTKGGIRRVFARVDSCAGEFDAITPYMYSTWGSESEARPTEREKVVILGAGPNRIGQGIEFDYCCVHAALALQEMGLETIMVNCNPETVSTDYDTSDRLYFEPITLEDVMAIAEVERPLGVVVQFGGQTPLRMAVELERAGIRILGTPADAIDRAEDRERFEELLTKLELRRPRGGIAHSLKEAYEVADSVGYPLLVRPSYVLGGRAMEVVHCRADLARYMRGAILALEHSGSTAVLLDEFLGDAIEVDVDCICDGTMVVIGGVMQHIEEAGIHSGDSACVLPPYSLSEDVLSAIAQATQALALELGVVGLMNVQYAVRGADLYVIEANPRASRTVPFVSKAIGRPLAKLAAKVAVGESLRSLGFTRQIMPSYTAVKEAVFPFLKFSGVDSLLGPEMRSTGEAMGIGRDFAEAFRKAAEGAGSTLPNGGTVFVSVRDVDKAAAVELACGLMAWGFTIAATAGTAAAMERANVSCAVVRKVREGHPHVVDLIRDGEVTMVINTTSGEAEIQDSASLRRQTLMSGIPYHTTMAAAAAAVQAITTGRRGAIFVRTLQEYQSSSVQMISSALSQRAQTR